MILMNLLAFIVGFWNRQPKLKARGTGRCVCNPWCIENHMGCLLNSEVWNSILILRFRLLELKSTYDKMYRPLNAFCLSALLPVAEGHAKQALQDLQDALKETEHLFNNSDARLYTPNIDRINACTFKFFDCFLMEMTVLLHDEDPTNDNNVKIKTTLDVYKTKTCRRTEYYCERQELANPMVFFERMKTFLQKQMSLCNNPQNVTCD